MERGMDGGGSGGRGMDDGSEEGKEGGKDGRRDGGMDGEMEREGEKERVKDAMCGRWTGPGAMRQSQISGQVSIVVALLLFPSFTFHRETHPHPRPC